MQQPIDRPIYTEYHPRWYRPRVSVYWWLGQWRYLKFILRELSSVFVALVVLMTILQMRAVQNGPQAYARFQHQLHTPAAIVISMITLFFVVFHAITWFNLTPRAMAVRVRGKRIPEWLVAAPNYALWAVISVGVSLLVLRGR